MKTIKLYKLTDVEFVDFINITPIDNYAAAHVITTAAQDGLYEVFSDVFTLTNDNVASAISARVRTFWYETLVE